MALSVNGLRLTRKIKAVGSYIAALPPHPNVCILTETHLLKPETDRVRYDTYDREHDSGREDGATQACGEVFILAKIGLRFRNEDALPNVALPPNGCSVVAFPEKENLSPFRTAGV